MRWIGVDVAKDSLEVSIPSAARRFSVSNNTEGLAELADELKKLDEVRVVFEATGGYEAGVLDALWAAKITFSRVNPRQVRDFAKAMNWLAKTDRIDADLLALFGEKLEPEATIPPNESLSELQNLVGRRRQLVDMRAAEIVRRQQVRGRRIVRSVEDTIKFLTRQIEKLDKDIDDTMRRLPDWQAKQDVLSTIKGVGRVTSRTFMALLPELGCLSGKQIAALIGVAPFNDDSGKSEKRKRIRAGREDVRRVLYMAAMSARTWDPTISAFYNRLLAAGKVHKVAVVACMRKMAVILNARMKELLAGISAAKALNCT